MIELAFVVCMKTMMHLCEERSIAYLPDVSLMGCMMQAQPQLAEWAATHPESASHPLDVPAIRRARHEGLNPQAFGRAISRPLLRGRSRDAHTSLTIGPETVRDVAP